MKIRHVLISLVMILMSANPSGAAEILNIRSWAAPDHTRVVFDLAAEPAYDVKESEKLLTLNFPEATYRLGLPAEIAINKPGIKKVILNLAPDGSLKADFILDKYLKTQVFPLKKFQDKPDRIVVDIYVEAHEEEIARDASSKAKKKKIIVIDPGHGGDDPGAIGKKGTYEKNIVLAIGREIKKAVNGIPGYQAVLTRDGDYYVSFNKRMQVAKDANASLFISVHADAARNRNAKGSSVYCLSNGAASNEAARLLAKNENLSDIIGGVPNGEGKTDSDQIILNMFQTNTINFSKTYAVNLMRELDKLNGLKNKSVQEAPFRVLKLPDIPAVLMETAYISNAEEEKLLKNGGFQKKLARAVASSVTQYLSGTTYMAEGIAVAKASNEFDRSNAEKPAEKDNAPDPVNTSHYRIKRGDTLFSIARLFNTKVNLLLKLNNMKIDDPLLSNRKILVPVSNPTPDIKTKGASPVALVKDNKVRGASRIYIVKKGDTLFSLAKNNSLTLDELCRLNHLKSSDTLLMGQKIELP